MVDVLVEMDVSFLDDVKQSDGSTSLHAAAYYRQPEVVEVLLQHGADPTVKNRWGNTPEDEAPPEIKKIIKEYKNDEIFQLFEKLKEKKLINRIHVVKEHNKPVIEEGEEPTHFTKMQELHDHWLHIWHGSRTKHLPSILENGLQKPGTKLKDGTTIPIPSGHIQAGTRVHDVDNWAMAIFLTPNIFYATNPVYSDVVTSHGEKWCVVIKAAVEKGSFTAYKSTTPLFDKETKKGIMPGEPCKKPEYRVEDSHKVIVEAVVFVSGNFLHEHRLDGKTTYAELEAILIEEYDVTI